MSHGFSQIFTDQDHYNGINLLVMNGPGFRRLLFDNDRNKIRENPCESVAKVAG
jgi:hypothetical protein